MTQPPPGQEPVDGVDESDHDAMEVALGAAIALLLVAWLMPGFPSFFGNARQARRNQLEAAIGPTLRSFLARSASDLAAASGQPGASTHAVESAADAYPPVFNQVDDWVEMSYQRLAAGLSEPAAPAGDTRPWGEGAPAPDRPDDELQHVQSLAETAATQDARAAAAYARNEVREETAGRIGALWSIWKTRHDNRVRETHADLNDHKVPFGGRFVVDGGRAYLRYPGDPEAPPSETMGCRCHLVYRFRDRSVDYAEV